MSSCDNRNVYKGWIFFLYFAVFPITSFADISFDLLTSLPQKSANFVGALFNLLKLDNESTTRQNSSGGRAIGHPAIAGDEVHTVDYGSWYNPHTGGGRIPVEGDLLYQGPKGFPLGAPLTIPISKNFVSFYEADSFVPSVGVRSIIPDFINWSVFFNNGSYLPEKMGGFFRSITPFEGGYRIYYQNEGTLTYSEFDAQGRKTRDIHNGVVATTYQYANKLLEKITDAFGNTLLFEYAPNALGSPALVKMSNSRTKLITGYRYDTKGRLVEVTNNTGGTIATIGYINQSSFTVRGIYYPDTNTTDDIRHYSDGSMKYYGKTYNDIEFGTWELVQYPSANSVVSNLPDRSTTTYTIEGTGANTRVVSIKDKQENSMEVTYDSVFPELISEVVEKSVIGNGMFHTYIKTFLYNNNGRLREYREDGIATKISYVEPFGLVRSIILPGGAVWTFTYNRLDGRLLSYKDPVGHMGTYGYDSNKFVNKYVTQDSTLQWESINNSKGQAIHWTNGIKSFGFGYDPGGSLQSVTDNKLGGGISYQLNLPGSTSATIVPPSNSTFGHTLTTTNLYDLNGKHLSTSSAYSTVQTEHLEEGGMLRVTTPKSNGLQHKAENVEKIESFSNGGRDPGVAQSCKLLVDGTLMDLCFGNVWRECTYVMEDQGICEVEETED